MLTLNLGTLLALQAKIRSFQVQKSSLTQEQYQWVDVMHTEFGNVRISSLNKDTTFPPAPVNAPSDTEGVTALFQFPTPGCSCVRFFHGRLFHSSYIPKCLKGMFFNSLCHPSPMRTSNEEHQRRRRRLCF